MTWLWVSKFLLLRRNTKFISCVIRAILNKRSYVVGKTKVEKKVAKYVQSVQFKSYNVSFNTICDYLDWEGRIRGFGHRECKWSEWNLVEPFNSFIVVMQENMFNQF